MGVEAKRGGRRGGGEKVEWRGVGGGRRVQRGVSERGGSRVEGVSGPAGEMLLSMDWIGLEAGWLPLSLSQRETSGHCHSGTVRQQRLTTGQVAKGLAWSRILRRLRYLVWQLVQRC